MKSFIYFFRFNRLHIKKSRTTRQAVHVAWMREIRNVKKKLSGKKGKTRIWKLSQKDGQ